MSEPTYRVVRFSQRGRPRVIERGLTLAQAQTICNDPSTSSRTKNPSVLVQQRLDANRGHWFYGYERE